MKNETIDDLTLGFIYLTGLAMVAIAATVLWNFWWAILVVGASVMVLAVIDGLRRVNR